MRVFLYAYVLPVVILTATAPAFAQRPCPSQRPAVLVNRDVASLRWTDCSSGSQEAFSFPYTTRVLPRQVPVFKAGYTGPFEKQVEVVDTVWVDDVIEISEPLRSYGGDIILYANEIRINAPIDSRFHIFHDINHFTPGAEKHANGFAVGEKFNAYTWTTYDDMQVPFGGSWKQYYEHCFDCPGDGRIPELPSGLIGDVVVNTPNTLTPKPGYPPPDDSIIFDNVRAGNIYIFAKEIHVSDSLKQPFVPEDRAECKGTSTNFVPFAISAAGARGGRGGAGAATWVGKIVPDRMFNMTADALSQLGQLNAPGGRGGDAGNVYIRIVSDDTNIIKNYRDELSPLISVAGGVPGSNAKLNTPSSWGPHVADGTRCSFVDAGEKWLSAEKGQDGVKSIEGADTTTALQTLVALLSSKDSRTDYDFRVVLQETNLDTEQYSTTASSALTTFLARHLVQSQSNLLDDLDHVFAGGPSKVSNYSLPMLSGLDMARLQKVSLPDPQQTLLNQLSYFSEKTGPYDYMIHIGGIFNIDTNQQFTRFIQKLSYDEIATSNTILAEIEGNLTQLNEQMFEQIAKADTREFNARITKLKNAIDEAQRKAAASKAPTLLGEVPLLKDLGDAIVKTIADIYGDNYAGAAEEVGKIGKAYDSLNEYNNQPDLLKDIPQLQNELAEVQVAYQAFSEYVAVSKSAYISREAKDLGRVLDARLNVRRAQIANSLYVHDLIRATFLSYLVDPSKDTATLSDNFKALKTYVQRSPREYPLLTLKDLFDWGCAQKPTDCYTVVPTTRSSVLLGPLSGQMWPLYVFAPSETSTTKPLFGIPQSKVKIQPLPRSATATGSKSNSASSGRVARTSSN